VPGAPDARVIGDGVAAAGGNRRIRTFDEGKRELLRIYSSSSAPSLDVYCGCPFAPAERGSGLRVDLAACGFVTAGSPERAERIEWEHAVPAAAFGRSFVEWREGSDRCVDAKGKRYRGRRCARTSPEFARMEGDLHNLFPVVGEVNAARGDLPMGILDPPSTEPAHHRARETTRFTGCASSVEEGVFLPRREVRGDLARAYKYMAAAYPDRRIVDPDHRAIFDQWDREDPPDAWERERNRRIAAVQGNPNPFIAD
jgi:deoxyribonuclease-1